MDETTLKSIIAENITACRKAKGLTQLEVAEKLNYTDKAVSKWERAESIPDITTLYQLAELYGVTLNDLCTEHSGSRFGGISKVLRSHKLIIPFLSAGLVWLVATVVFSFLAMFQAVPKPWLAFLYAVPVSIIVLLVFNAIWGNKIFSSLLISFLIWSIPTCLVLTITFTRIWFLFIIPIPLQILVVLWYIMRIKASKEKS